MEDDDEYSITEENKSESSDFLSSLDSESLSSLSAQESDSEDGGRKKKKTHNKGRAASTPKSKVNQKKVVKNNSIEEVKGE